MASDRAFVDTNILLYALDAGSPEKQIVASDLTLSLTKAGVGVISAQVANEFSYNLGTKLKLSSDQVREYAEALQDYEVRALTLETLFSALEIKRQVSISLWDALIVASAKEAGCTTLYTEDLNHGQEIAGVRITNPFLPTSAQ